MSCERRKKDEVRRPWKERKGSSPPASSSDSEDAALGNFDSTAVGKCLWVVLRCVHVYEGETSEITTDVSSLCTLDGAMW